MSLVKIYKINFSSQRTSYSTHPTVRKAYTPHNPIAASRVVPSNRQSISLFTMAVSSYSLFLKTMTLMAPSHGFFKNHRGLATFLIIMALTVCAMLLPVLVGIKQILVVPFILAITAALLCVISLWSWVYLAVPLTSISYLATFTIFAIAYAVPGYGDIHITTFFIAFSIWAVLALPVLYPCVQFYRYGRRQLTHPGQSQDPGNDEGIALDDLEFGEASSQNANQDVDGAADLTFPPPAHTAPSQSFENLQEVMTAREFV